MKGRRTCQTCKHFRQHYVKWGEDDYQKCGSGHCVYPRLKPRRNETKACQYYSPAEKTEDG
ncbi:hypothetical protein D1646_18570 [Pseudoflavonifractor sp. 60]|uniref:hypothetical protein n=1 Tax=Pseudoflavonifractor sp. 60 TaxID=2304576 RepID=UPI00136EE52B|nr:hypothetical protein [Pseudoflavonifractor sp. 60]NBI68749.1 hypothetical protein [Pseudoflavonifractor sp. 60]